MQKVRFFKQNPFRQNKVCLRMIAVAVVVVLMTSAFFMPAGAVEPAVGYTTQNTTVYSAFDAISGQNNKAVLSESSDASTWKLAIGSSDSVFKSSTEGFAAPEATLASGGLKLTWQKSVAPYSIVFITDGDSYAKEFNCSSNELLVTDLELGKTYGIQVTAGDDVSEVLTYDYKMIPSDEILLSSGARSGKFNMNSNNNRFFVNLGAGAESVTSTGALVVKIDTEMLPDNAIVFDTNLGTNKNGEAYPAFSSNDAWVGISTSLYSATVTTETGDDGSEWTRYDTDGSGNDSITKEGTNYPYIIDDERGIVKKQSSSFVGTNGIGRDWYKNSFVYQGYLIIPFDNYKEDTLAKIRENGYITVLTQSYRYYHQYYNANGNTDFVNLTPNHTSTDLAEKFGDTFTNGVTNNNASNPDFVKVFDRQFTLSEVNVVADYESFIEECVGSYGLEIAFASQNAGMSYVTTWSNSVEDGQSVISSVANDFSSVYKIYVQNKKRSRSFSFVAANGEKMSLGFKAPAAGIYELAASISANADDGVYYDVIKTDAAGNRSVVQEMHTYDGESGLCDAFLKLNAGDTVWIEAWSDTEAAVIDIGVPQAIKHNSVADGSYTFRAIDYFESKTDNGYSYDNAGYVGDKNAAWEMGYFENPVTVTDDTTDYDGLGISALQVDGDAAALTAALTPYNTNRSGNVYNPEIKNSETGALLSSDIGGYPGGMAAKKSSTERNVTALADSNVIHTKFGYYDITNSSNAVYADGTSVKNIGVYLKLTVPADGMATLRLTDENCGMGNANVYTVVLINDTVKYVDKKEVAKGTSIELGELKKGDTVSLCYSIVNGTNTVTFLGNPAVILKTALSSVTFGADTDCTAQLVANGTVMSLPAMTRWNSLFRGWSDGNALFSGDYTVDGDVHFTPCFAYYGDVNADNNINADDLAAYKKHILGNENIAEENLDIADVNADKKVDILDLVRMKKFFAGTEATLGA